MLVGDRLVPRVYAQARAPARSGLNPVIMVYFHSTFDLAMTPVGHEYGPPHEDKEQGITRFEEAETRNNPLRGGRNKEYFASGL